MPMTRMMIGVRWYKMYEFDSRVRYSELAEDKRLSLVSIINYFQDCCTFEAEDAGVGLAWLAERHDAWMLINWHIRINRRPDYAEKIHVKTWAIGFKHFIGERNFTVKTDDGEILVYAYSKWAYVNTEKGVPEKSIPQTEVDAYGISEPLEAEFKKGKIKLPEEMTAVDPIIVTEGNLDTNHHVNNAEYMELALSAVSNYLNRISVENSISSETDTDRVEKADAADREISSYYQGVLNGVTEIRAEYKLQSVLGDVIYPFVALCDNIITVVLKDADGNSKLIVELELSDAEEFN